MIGIIGSFDSDWFSLVFITGWKKNILPETLVQVMVSSFALFLVLGGIGYLLWIIYKETVKIREHLDKLDHRLEEIDQDE